MEPTTPTRSHLSRWGSVAGLGFAILMLYALIGPPSGPDQNASDATWQSFIADGGNRIWIIAEVVAGTIAGVLFVVFMASLREHGLLSSTSGRSILGYGFGLLFVMSMFAAFAAWASVPASVAIGGEPVPTADVIRLSGDLGRAFISLPLSLSAGAFAIAMGFDARAARICPRWVATAGVVVGVVELLLGVNFFPLVLFPLWVAALSVALFRHSPARPAVATHTRSLA